MRKVSDGVFEFEDTEIDIIVGALRLLAETHRDIRTPAVILDIIYDKMPYPDGEAEWSRDADDFDQLADELLGDEPEGAEPDAPDDLTEMLNEVAPKKRKSP